jgi:hypothetical protein
MRFRFLLQATLFATGFALVVLGVALGVAQVSAQSEESVQLPNDYRFWYHVGSKSITAEAAEAIGLPDIFNDTFDAVFANVVALNDLRNNTRPYRDGASFVAPFFKLAHPVEGMDSPGDLAFTAVMLKDSTLYADTGGWGFAVFGPDKLPVEGLGSGCFTCHESQAENDFVFSTLSERAVSAVPASDNGVFLPPDYRNKLYWRGANVIRPEAATALGLQPEIFGNTFDSVYLNNAALNALASESRPFPVGSLFVADFHALATPIAGLGAYGDQAFTAVMIKGDPGTGDDPSTGDWRFEAFDAAGKPMTAIRGACISCHAGQAANDYVFAGG